MCGGKNSIAHQKHTARYKSVRRCVSTVSTVVQQSFCRRWNVYIYDFLEIQQDFQDKIKSSLFTERIFKITVGFSILFDYVKYERCVHFYFFHSQNRKQYSFQQEFFLFPYFGTVHHQEAYDDRAQTQEKVSVSLQSYIFVLRFQALSEYMKYI